MNPVTMTTIIAIKPWIIPCCSPSTPIAQAVDASAQFRKPVVELVETGIDSILEIVETGIGPGRSH
jgi:hypothetical protein